MKTEIKKRICLILISLTLIISMFALPNQVKAATQVDQIISYARSLIGSADYNGYCQRFVKVCYQSAGIYASPDAASAIDAWHMWGLSTSKTDIPVGACVYFTNSSIYGHVGIYVGNGKMIDANGNSGVVERTISADSWNNYLGWGYQAGIKPEGSEVPIALSAPNAKAIAADGKVSLYWGAVTGATEYWIYSFNSAANTYTKITSVTGTTYTQTGLINGITYTYLVKAYNGSSFSSYSTANHVSAKPIAAPVVTAMAGDGKVILNWRAVTGATCYRIYSYSSVTKTYKGITTVSGTSYTQNGLTNGQSYTYLVLAYNGISWTYTDSANHITARPIEAPVVTAVAGDGKVTLKWGAVTGATCYRIYAYNSTTKAYSGITTVMGTSFTQSGLINGKTYTYLVLAYNGVSWNYTDTANNISAVPHK